MWDISGPALALDLLGDVATLRGDWDRAESDLEHALEIGRESRNPYAVALALAHLGRLAHARGDQSTAAARLTEAVPLLGTVTGGFGLYPTLAQAWLGDVAQEAGDRDGAVAAWGVALAMAEASGNPLALGRVRQRLARVARGDDDLRRAEELVHDALGCFVERGDRAGVVGALEDLAVLAVDHESWAEAVRLFAAADSEREVMGYARLPPDARASRHTVDGVREILGDEGFATAWSEGAAMSTDQAVAYARKRRGSRKRPSSGWASLTPTELQVAGLVAEGLTNPAIAERLFVTRGTVKVHLSHIFAKLGVTNRTELAAVAIRHGAAG